MSLHRFGQEKRTPVRDTADNTARGEDQGAGGASYPTDERVRLELRDECGILVEKEMQAKNRSKYSLTSARLPGRTLSIVSYASAGQRRGSFTTAIISYNIVTNYNRALPCAGHYTDCAASNTGTLHQIAA